MSCSILVLRFGAMGDVLHALPAVASLKRSFADARISWMVRPKWMGLLEGNPSVDAVVPFRRGESLPALWHSLKQARRLVPDLAFDFQGLIQSALAGRWARPGVFWGFDHATVRETIAAVLYSRHVNPPGPHRIERNLQLVAAAGATQLTNESWIPKGRPEGDLPDGPFVLAAPFAGWGSKQWPIERYAQLQKLLEREHVRLVLNVAPQQAAGLAGFRLHVSSLPGLIDATRRAVAVIGVDSGPLHLAAALRKPGVAIFGPTDPATHGPYGGSIRVIRKSGHSTTYKREQEIHPGMRAVTAEEVFEHLAPQLRQALAVTGQLR